MTESRYRLYFLALVIPLAVVPGGILENSFFWPKFCILITGVSLMIVTLKGGCLNANALIIELKGGCSNSQATRWAIFLALFCLSSMLWTENPYYTRQAAVLNIACLGVFYLASVTIRDARAAMDLFLCIGIGGVLVSIETFLQHYNQSFVFPWLDPRNLPIGTIGNSNYLGCYLLFPLFALAGLALLGRIGFFWTWPFVFAALIVSRARASWLGLAIATPIMAIAVWRMKKIRLRKGWKMWAGIALVLAFVAVPLSTTDLRRPFEVDTVKLRLDYWRASWVLFVKHPVVGSGLWSYRNMVYDAQADLTESGYFERNYDPKPRRAHNDYLEVLNDGGIVGAAALGVFLFVVMRNGWRVIRDRERDQEIRIVAAACFSCVISVMGAALFFFPSREVTALFLLSLMLGVMEGLNGNYPG